MVTLAAMWAVVCLHIKISFGFSYLPRGVYPYTLVAQLRYGQNCVGARNFKFEALDEVEGEEQKQMAIGYYS